MSDSKSVESATTQLATQSDQPDSKTRRYDRQLRLWAATGQAALETSRILVLSASATATSILKNLVLPGIGHFTILDRSKVSPHDAGNNFFLSGPASIGRSRAEEAVRLLSELNDSVQGVADTSDLKEILDTRKEYLTSFSLIIAHNLDNSLLERVEKLLWEDESYPSLVIVRSAGFLAEFSIQFHEHTIIESHSETAPSLRIDKPFPTLLNYALSLDWDALDSTDHAHIPYVVILVRVLHDWKQSHGGNPPKTTKEKSDFKDSILALQRKHDEENFEEAHAQAYRCWTPTVVPSSTAALFADPRIDDDTFLFSPSTPPFFRLLRAVRDFAKKEGGVLPLAGALPDMKADTEGYVRLQRMYKDRAEVEKGMVRELLVAHAKTNSTGGGAEAVDEAVLDSFLKNAHAIRVLKGKRWSELDGDKEKLANLITSNPKETSIHLALSALNNLSAKTDITKAPPTVEPLTAEAQALLPPGTELPEEEFAEMVGEIARAPTADLPNTAAFLGGLVAQEVIKMITKQYVPLEGCCVVDLVQTATGVI